MPFAAKRIDRHAEGGPQQALWPCAQDDEILAADQDGIAEMDPRAIELPAVAPAVEHTHWTELFKYPRSIFAGALTGLSQTGGVGLGLWQVTSLVMVLQITPAEASKLGIWIAVAAIAGRFLCSWTSDAWGRRPAGCSAA